MNKKIGLLGGTFDPPHLGHLIVANEVLIRLDLDEIRFMPNHIPPHKERKSNATSDDRAKMIELSIEDNPSFKIETIELERSGKSYTYDTIKLLKKREPDADFYFIIGADMIEFLPNWYKIEELMSMVQFVGVKRPEHSVLTRYPVIHVENTPEINISSTTIRDRIKEKVSVKYLMDNKVLKYIKEKKLYGAE